MTDDSSDVSVLLARARNGDEDALRRVTDILNRELHLIAAREMRREDPEHTLQPTALVNEAFMRLLRGRGRIQNRHHFLGLAARTMRRVLVDHARKKRSRKRGRGVERVTLDDDLPVGSHPRPVDVLDLDAALSELEAIRSRALAASSNSGSSAVIPTRRSRRLSRSRSQRCAAIGSSPGRG